MTLPLLAIIVPLLAQAHAPAAEHGAAAEQRATEHVAGQAAAQHATEGHHDAAGNAAEHGQAGEHGEHGFDRAACLAKTPMERCLEGNIFCNSPDHSVAGHIFHHVQDEVYYPICLDRGAGKVFDLSISKHVVWMWVASALLIVAFGAAVGKRSLVPKGFYSLLESFVLFIRDEIAIKNIGEHDGHRYVGYLCTAFFFIFFMNLVGLLPYGASATGNLSVTVVLALCTFIVTQVAGMRAQGVGGYWMHLVPSGVPKWLWPIMLPVEILGLFTKPFALTVRLFANMVAGHIVIFFLIALTVLISVYVAPVSIAFALGIFMLELFVALVQAYVFTMLSALFIGMAAHSH